MSNYIFNTTLLQIYHCFQPLFLLHNSLLWVLIVVSHPAPGKHLNYSFWGGGRWGKMANLAIFYSKEAWCQSFLAWYSFSLKSPIKPLKLSIKPGKSFLFILCRLHWSAMMCTIKLLALLELEFQNWLHY